jgi:hypothetical protein
MAESRNVKNDHLTGQRQRVKQSVLIRKQKRMQHLKKRRNNTDADQTSLVGQLDLFGQPGQPGQPGQIHIANLARYVQMVNQTDDAAQLQGARSIRKVLSDVSDSNNMPAKAVIETNVIPRLVQLMKRIDKPVLQFEAAWALTNIASTSLTEFVAVDQPPTMCNAAPIMVQLMRSPDPDVRDQCCWAIGNIVGDSTKLRDMVMAIPNSLNNLLLNITKASSEAALQNAVWALSNMCRGQPRPCLQVAKQVLPVLAKLVIHDSKHALIDAMWALSYLTDGNDDDIQAVLDVVPAKRLVDLAGHFDIKLVTPALRCIGNIVSGNDAQTQALIDTGGLFARMSKLLDHSRAIIKKEACWTLSNIAAGTVDQARQLAQYVDTNQSLLSKVANLVVTGDFGVKKEACWTLANLCSPRADPVCIAKVVASKPESGLSALCQALTIDDPAAILVTMEALEAILLSQVPSEKPIEQLFEEYGALDHLESLQEHASEDVYNKAAHIIATYFSQQGDSDDDAPAFEQIEPFAPFAPL